VPRELRRLAGIQGHPAAIAAARPLLTAAQLPLLNRVAREVVGRETIELIDSRLDGEMRRAA
jgi:hypothetical protein